MHVADDTFKCEHCPRLYCSTNCKTIDHTKWQHAEYCPNLTPPTIMTDVVEPLMDFFTASTELPADASDEERREVFQQGKEAHESSSKWMHEMKHTLSKLFQHHPGPLKAIQLYFDNIKDLNERTSRLVRRVAQDETLSKLDQQAMFGKIVTDSNAISAFYTEILEVQMDQALNTPEFQEYGLPDAPLGLNLIFRRVHVKVALKKGLETVLDDRSPSSVTVEELAGMKLGVFVNCDPTANPDGVELRAFVSSGLRRTHLITGDEPLWAVLESFGKIEEILKAWKLREWAVNSIAKKLETFFTKWEIFKPHSKKPDDSDYNPRCVYQEWAAIADPAKKAEFADEALVEMFERFPHLALYDDPKLIGIIDTILTVARLILASRLGVAGAQLWTVGGYGVESFGRLLLLPLPSLMKWLGGFESAVSLREIDTAKEEVQKVATKFNDLNKLIPGRIHNVTYNPIESTYYFGGIGIAPATGKDTPNSLQGMQSSALETLERFIISTGSVDSMAKNNRDWHQFYNTTMALEKTPVKEIFGGFDLTSKDETIRRKSVAAVIQSIASFSATDPADLKPLFSSPVFITSKSSLADKLRAATAAVLISPQLLMNRAEHFISVAAIVVTMFGIFNSGNTDMVYGAEMLRNLSSAIYFTDWFFRFANLFNPSGNAPHTFKLEVSDDARRIGIANDEIEFEHIDPKLLEHLRTSGISHWANTTVAGWTGRPSVSTSSGKTYYGTISRSASTAMVQGINMLWKRSRKFMHRNPLEILGTQDAEAIVISAYYIGVSGYQIFHWVNYWYQQGAVATAGNAAISTAITIGQVATMASGNKALQNLMYIERMTDLFNGITLSNSPSYFSYVYMLYAGYQIISSGWTIGTMLMKNRKREEKKEERRRRERSASHPPPREETRRIEEATQQELQQTDGANRLKLVSDIVKAGLIALTYFTIQAYVGSPQLSIGAQPPARKWVETKKKK